MKVFLWPKHVASFFESLVVDATFFWNSFIFIKELFTLLWEDRPFSAVHLDVFYSDCFHFLSEEPSTSALAFCRVLQ